MLDLQKLSRVLAHTIATWEIIIRQLSQMKSGITKVSKQFSDSKKVVNSFKSSVETLNICGERLEKALDNIGLQLSNLKSSDKILISEEDIQANLLDDEVFQKASLQKNFLTDYNRDCQYLLASFASNIKEKMKAVKNRY